MGIRNVAPFALRYFEKKRHDYAGVAAVATAVWPEYPATVRGLQQDDADRDSGLTFGRIVAESEDRIVGFAVYGQPEFSPRPGKYFIHAAVHPDHRRRGLGAALYDRVLETLSPHRPTDLIASTHDDQTDTPGFLARRGFDIVLRRPVLRLDVRSFDRDCVRSDTLHEGIVISPLSDLMTTVPDWKRRCWELDWEIVQDIPLFETPVRPTFERFSRTFEDPEFTPDSCFIARHGDAWVGMSILSTDPSTPRTYFTGVTGVRREFRRKGIATALKLRGIAYVRTEGGHVIETDNEENNPMLDLNLALGFERGRTFLEFRKIL